MRKLTLSTALLSAGLAVSAFGCIDSKLDADAMDPTNGVGERPPTFCGEFGTLKPSFDRARYEIQCKNLQDNYIANVQQRIRSTDIDSCCECFFPGTICPSGQKLVERSRCEMMNEDFSQRFEDAIANGVSAMYCPKPNSKDRITCCEPIDNDPIDDPIDDDPIIDDTVDDTQGDGCREGVIDDSWGGADHRPACSQPYPWPSGNPGNYRDWCSLCSASTNVPYNPFDPNEDNAWKHYASRNIGSPPTTCSNALLGAKSFHRTSQECADFRNAYAGVCCGREPACSYMATWYKDSPELSCDDAPATGRCRCADDLTAPARPDAEIRFPVYDLSATSPFAQAVSSNDLCGVEIGTNQFGLGEYKTTCARLYEALRRGFTQKYECGHMKNMLRDKCGSLPINP